MVLTRKKDSLRGQGGVFDFQMVKNRFYVFLIEGSKGYQMLLTGSKNIDPRPSYRILKFVIFIQLHCSRTLLSRLSQNLDFQS